MTTEEEVRDILRKTDAVITGSHIVYASWKHGRAYVNKDAVYPHTAEISRLCRALAERFKNDVVEVVIAPAVGGVILSQWVARHLSVITGRDVLALYADKEGDAFVLKRGYDKLAAGKRALVVEDVLTTGGTVAKVVDATRAAGGFVVGLGALVNRGGVKHEDIGNAPRMEVLLSVTLEAWDEADCPLCRDGIPVNTDLGRGKEFLARKQV